jgi:hypothetical protein
MDDSLWPVCRREAGKHITGIGGGRAASPRHLRCKYCGRSASLTAECGANLGDANGCCSYGGAGTNGTDGARAAAVGAAHTPHRHFPAR